MFQRYMKIIFKSNALNLINIMNEIIDTYRAVDMVLTVRQLYYQLVARGHIPNHERSYQKVTRIVNNARLAGLIDWDMIEDRTRAFRGQQRWGCSTDILNAAATSYHMDMWEGQEHRVFAIVEKDALYNVLRKPCRQFDVPLLAARGYPSSSVLREFVTQYVIPHSDQAIHIIQLGDHDPSGIDMTRDLKERIGMFCNGQVENISLTRLALNMDQIEEKQPPPNPAKMTDSRVGNYIAEYGESSWELDALDPSYLMQIMTDEIKSVIDEGIWQKRQAEIDAVSVRLQEFVCYYEPEKAA